MRKEKKITLETCEKNIQSMYVAKCEFMYFNSSTITMFPLFQQCTACQST